MPPVPWIVKVQDHPGSKPEEVENEPDWGAGHQHRIGFKNRQDRVPGFTNPSDEWTEEEKEAVREDQELHDEEKQGKLVNWRDIMSHEKDFHLRTMDNRGIGWRYVLEVTEDFVRNKQEWPANVGKRQKEEEAKKEKKQGQKDQSRDQQKGQYKQEGNQSHGDQDSKDQQPQQEHEWKKDRGENSKHHDAYAGSAASDQRQDSGGEGQKTEYEKLREKYSPQEIALLRSLQHEKDYIANLTQSDGKGESPQKRNKTQTSIDEADQFSPDNWVPRSDDLIRLTGKHPLNAEAHLSHLFEAGLITPNELHYVRNHGAVPRILWEFHEIDVENGKLKLSMNCIKNKFDAINIAVALACDGNRRKELNMIKRSKGFNWGPGAVSCAYWKGPLLRDILLAAGVPDMPLEGCKRQWVNFQGADQLSEGVYATSIPLDYAMDSTNDVILAYEMNDVPLPPDHGYPCRVMIPGYVGGRCVKWVNKIWVSDKENDSYYHIWDNRVLPSFVTEKDGEFAETLFNHPDTACDEQNLNSVIVRPGHGEKLSLTDARKGHIYRVEGYAYDGGGHEVQRVEVSLDEGKTWLYCIRKFPDAPIRHGKKFWTWLHWHVDMESTHLLQAPSITVRCFNVFKNTQPQHPNWNVMGMMNNCWYVVKPEITQDEHSDVPMILFRHPVEPGTGEGGWMKPSVENQIASAKQEADAPQKQFTRQEVEKHDKEDDCWIVVDGKVYDATSVLSWHPGGKAAILAHAGKVHQETSNEFESVHDGFAYQKLKECILGIVTDKAMNFIKKNAEAAAKEKAQSQEGDDQLTLQKHRWVPVRLIDRKPVSDDTRTYTFSLPDDKTCLGLGTCQHIQLGFHLADKILIRSYTPTRPLLPARPSAPQRSGAQANGDSTERKAHDSVADGDGTFDLTVKTYFPSAAQPGGALSNILDCMPLGEEVEIRGPTGEIVYNGHGKFIIDGKERCFKRVSLVLGGSGITPGYALIARVVLSEGDTTEIRVVDANKSEGDVLLKGELEDLVEKGEGRLKVTHVLSHPSEDWRGLKGHVNKEVIEGNLFEPGGESVAFLCGPPAMIQKSALPALTEWGYVEDEDVFGF